MVASAVAPGAFVACVGLAAASAGALAVAWAQVADGAKVDDLDPENVSEPVRQDLQEPMRQGDEGWVLQHGLLLLQQRQTG